MENEIWKDIPGYEGLYKVSNTGKVSSFQSNRYVILKIGKNTRGYTFTNLCNKKTRKSYLIHRLVAIAFIPNPENKPQVNHMNGIKHDNSIGNLEWVTQSENNFHSYAEGLRVGPWTGKYGKEHHGSKPILQYTKNGMIIKKWESAQDAYRELGISAQSIYRCLNGYSRSAGGFIWKRTLKNKTGTH